MCNTGKDNISEVKRTKIFSLEQAINTMKD